GRSSRTSWRTRPRSTRPPRSWSARPRARTATRSSRDVALVDAGAPAPPPGLEGPDPGRWRARLTTAAFLAPAVVLLAVWIVYPTIRTIVRSLFGRDGSEWVGLGNYKTLFTTDTLVTAIQNNAIWVAVVPALVAAIG